MARKKMPEPVETDMLVLSRRRCCLCVYLQDDRHAKPGQIAHLDQNPVNNDPDNLVFLCLPHHDQYDGTTSQSKGLTIAEVKHYRARWYAHVVEQDLRADAAGSTQHEAIDLAIVKPGRFFVGEVHQTISGAIAAASAAQKPIFLVIYDPDHPKQSRVNYSLGYFMEYDSTKKFVNDRFVQAVVEVGVEDARTFVPEGNQLENCIVAILSAEGQLRVVDPVYANPEEGMNRAESYYRKWAYTQM